MEDSLKYFQTEISDIRVGYECEESYNGDWKAHIVTNDSIRDSVHWCSMENIRVPYLTKEQIETEGWIERKSNEDIWKYQKGDFFIFYNLSEKRIMIDKGTPPLMLHTYFKGECKDINTFRYICKLLGI